MFWNLMLIKYFWLPLLGELLFLLVPHLQNGDKYFPTTQKNHVKNVQSPDTEVVETI